MTWRMILICQKKLSSSASSLTLSNHQVIHKHLHKLEEETEPISASSSSKIMLFPCVVSLAPFWILMKYKTQQHALLSLSFLTFRFDSEFELRSLTSEHWILESSRLEKSFKIKSNCQPITITVASNPLGHSIQEFLPTQDFKCCHFWFQQNILTPLYTVPSF